MLRIDGNFYDSYQDAFYYLYDLIPVGGIIILDDANKFHPAVLRFWSDFKKEQKLPEDLVPIPNDSLGMWFRKEKLIEIDFKYFRPPQDANK